jgi:D-xylose transport system permease protein
MHTGAPDSPARIAGPAGILVVALCNVNRAHFGVIHGLPYIIPIVLAVLFAWTILLQRTRFGRYVYAIGEIGRAHV